MRRLMTIAAAVASIAGSAGLGETALAGSLPNAGVGGVANGALPLEESSIFLGRLQLLLVWQWLEWTWLVLVRLSVALWAMAGAAAMAGMAGAAAAVAAGMVVAGMVAAGTAVAAVGMVAAVVGMAAADIA